MLDTNCPEFPVTQEQRLFQAGSSALSAILQLVICVFSGCESLAPPVLSGLLQNWVAGDRPWDYALRFIICCVVGAPEYILIPGFVLLFNTYWYALVTRNHQRVSGSHSSLSNN
ncbi:hypothetical protein R1flu_006256 [Riccia fluitans]|uniref:Uncharacterized protein n=1 Tax=Riccia fluitans TaxID=41844 RepID=A0ABD1YZJ6_9MARC